MCRVQFEVALSTICLTNGSLFCVDAVGTARDDSRRSPSGGAPRERNGDKSDVAFLKRLLGQAPRQRRYQTVRGPVWIEKHPRWTSPARASESYRSRLEHMTLGGHRRDQPARIRGEPQGSEARPRGAVAGLGGTRRCGAGTTRPADGAQVATIRRKPAGGPSENTQCLDDPPVRLMGLSVAANGAAVPVILPGAPKITCNISPNDNAWRWTIVFRTERRMCRAFGAIIWSLHRLTVRR